MLAASFSIPSTLSEAEQLKREHDQFQVAVEKTHASAVQVKYRADALRAANHYDPHTIREISEEVTERWQRLVTCAEERHKLVTASLNFYKTAEQVCSVLDSLEREYRRDEDWCGSSAAPVTDEPTLSQCVDKAAQVIIIYLMIVILKYLHIIFRMLIKYLSAGGCSHSKTRRTERGILEGLYFGSANC